MVGLMCLSIVIDMRVIFEVVTLSIFSLLLNIIPSVAEHRKNNTKVINLPPLPS